MRTPCDSFYEDDDVHYWTSPLGCPSTALNFSYFLVVSHFKLLSFRYLVAIFYVSFAHSLSFFNPLNPNSDLNLISPHNITH